MIFHTKYPNKFRASLRSAQFFLSAPPNLKSWIRPWFVNVHEHELLNTSKVEKKIQAACYNLSAWFVFLFYGSSQIQSLHTSWT